MISTLTVLTAAAARDLTTLSAVKSELSIGDASADTALADMIVQASDTIGGWCRRPEGFGAETVEQTIRRLPGDPARERLILDRDLVPAIAMVVEDGADLDPADWVIDGSLLVRLRADRPSRWQGVKTVITYTSGYNLPSGCPADLARCCLDLVVRMWNNRGRDPTLRSEQILDVISQSWIDPDKTELDDGLPVEIAARIGRYRRWSI